MTDMLREIGTFGLVWVACYAMLLALYAIPGLVIERIASRHPERRIQSRTPSDKRRDIRQSVISLATIALYVAGGLYAQWRGFTLFSIDQTSPAAILIGIVATVVAYDTWFYWFHRLMHTGRFYRFHAQHHRAIAPTTWSCNNDSFVGTFFEQSYFFFAAVLLPIPAVVLIAHKAFDQVTGMISHCGHEFFAAPSTRAPWPMLCTTFHDQHHSNFRVNFGNTFSIWDRVMGTLHPTYDEKVRAFEEIEANARRQPAE
mgnify:CR=1 FL=1